MSNPLTWTPECQSLTRSGWAESKERTLVYGTESKRPNNSPGPPMANLERLYAEFQPLVRRLIRQYGDTPEVREDLSKGIYHQFRVLVNAYDPARGIPIKPYLVRQLTATIYNYARRGWIGKWKPEAPPFTHEF